MSDFASVTELAAVEASQEQFERTCNRYYWAGEYCTDKDVLEVACGAGLGLGYLNETAKSVTAGDVSLHILKLAEQHYGERIRFKRFDAQSMPYENNSMDVIIIFEAIYYLPSAEKFISECRRVLKNGGKLLIATANKDLYDFNPSPFSIRYYGAVELGELLRRYGFQCEFFGYTAVDQLSWRQKLFRPAKSIAVRLHLIPKTMRGKKLFKRLIFGSLIPMPPEIERGMVPYIKPDPVSAAEPNTRYKVIYCAAAIQKQEGRFQYAETMP